MRKVWTKEELISFEDRIGDLYLDNQLPFLFHLSGGNEDQLIEIFKDIKFVDTKSKTIGAANIESRQRKSTFICIG